MCLIPVCYRTGIKFCTLPIEIKIPDGYGGLTDFNTLSGGKMDSKIRGSTGLNVKPSNFR